MSEGPNTSFRACGVTGGNALRAVMLLLVTGAPGLARLLLFLAVQRLLGLDALGRFASDVSVMQIFGFFSGVGVSALVMIRVSQAEESGRLSTALGLGLPAMVWLACGCLAMYGLSLGGWVFRPAPTVAVLAGFTVIMLVRRYLLALRAYARLLAVEVLVLALMMGGLWFFRSSGELAAYVGLAGSQLVVGLACVALGLAKYLAAGGGAMKPGPKSFSRSFEFGWTNLVSGGRGKLLVPITAHLCGEQWSGLVGLIQSVLGLVLLFPRGLAQFHLPDLASLSAKGRIGELRCVLDRFQSQVNWLLLALGLGLTAGWLAVGRLILSPHMQGAAQAGIFILLLMELAASQQVLPRANLLIGLERSRKLMILNTTALAAMLPFAAGALLFDTDVARVYWLSGWLLFSSVGRSAWLRIMGDSEMAALERKG